MVSKYSYKNILIAFSRTDFSTIQPDNIFPKTSYEFLVQSLFNYYIENHNINYYNNNAFMSKIYEIPFQKELYFIINYLEYKNETHLSLNSFDLETIIFGDWFEGH